MPYILILILCSSSYLAGVEKWSRFRGEGGQGIAAASTLPLKLSKKNLKWSFVLQGKGSSSPVVWQKKLFITAADKGQLKLFCLHTDTGEKIWSKGLITGNYHLHRFNNQAASTPCLTEKQVILTWFNGEKNKAYIASYSHDGEQQWIKEVGSFEGKHGFTMNLSTHNGKVIVSHLHKGESYIAALSCKDGSEQWKVKCASADVSYITPYIRNKEGKCEVIVSGAAMGVMSIDFTNGKVNWQLKKAHSKRTVNVAVEVKVDGQSYLSMSQKNYGYSMIRLPSKNTPSSELIWQAKKIGSYVPSHLAGKSSIYVLKDFGSLTQYDFINKKKIAQVAIDGNFYASPLLINNHIYCVTRNGKLIIVDTKNLKIVHEYDLDPPEDTDWVDATPAAANNSLYLRLGSRLYCYQ